jgi:Tol biopolymer transport system component
MSTTEPQSAWQKVRIVFIALGAAVVSVVLAVLVGLLAGIVISSTGLVHGELASWLGLIWAFYGVLAGIVLACFVSWWIVARGFGVSPTIRIRIAVSLLLIVPIAEFLTLRSPHMTGPRASERRINIDAISNDGKAVLVEVEEGEASHVVVIDTGTQRALRLPGTKDRNEGAAIAPDGTQVAFTSSHPDHTSEIMLCNVDGTNLHPLLLTSHNDYAPRFSPDGTSLYFARRTTPEYYATSFRLFSATLHGTDLRSIADRTFAATGNDTSVYPQSYSRDGGRVLMLSAGINGDSILIYRLDHSSGDPDVIVPKMSNGPVDPLIVSAFFSADDRTILLMAASQGVKAFDYDLYAFDLATRRLRQLTYTHSYASDFRLSSNGQYAVFFVWKSYSRLNSVPIDPSLQILETRTGTLRTVLMPEIP